MILAHMEYHFRVIYNGQKFLTHFRCLQYHINDLNWEKLIDVYCSLTKIEGSLHKEYVSYSLYNSEE